MATNISLKPYTEGEDVNCFLERLEQYFTANNVPENKQVATLLILVSENVYKIVKNLCHPQLPKEKTFKEIENALRLRFQPRISHFRKRITFDKLTQLEGELVSKWYARVRETASDCNFGSLVEERVKDKFVTGLLPGPVQERLCEESTSKLVTQLLDIALNKEASLQVNINKINVRNTYKNNSNNNTFTKEDQGSSNKSYTNVQKGSVQKLLCIHCGKPDHVFAKCKYKVYKCKKCQKVGHLASVCKSKHVNCVAISNPEEDHTVDMFNLTENLQINYVSPFILHCFIEGKSVLMELDTGATVSCITENIYLKNFLDIKLEPSNIELKTYSGEILKPLGTLSIKLKYKDMELPCDILVVKQGVRCLFGRDLIKKFNLNISHSVNTVTDKIETKLQDILNEYEEIFKNELGVIKGEEIKLEVKEDCKPIFHKPRPIPYAFKDKVEAELIKLEKQGVIEKVENSKWGTPLVPVLREDGDTLRLCANYKITVNKYLKDFNHPIPRIDEIFTALQGGLRFTKLDLRNAFNHLILHEDTKELLAWSTPKGIYKINRLPYGTKPASQIFQAKLEKILLGAKGAVNFIDDVVITGETDISHLENLKEVLRRFKEVGIRLNKSKCLFFQEEIRYLGHIISKDGLKKDKSHLDAIVNAPIPKDITGVRSWIGMVNYYAKFVPQLSVKLKPIYDLLKKNKKFEWNTKCDNSFELVKKNLISDSILVHFNPKLPLRLACDASQDGIGAVLSHIMTDGSDRPITFISRVYSKAEQGYSMIHKEALAIYWSVQKLYQYLIGTKFELLSDHKPLQALFGENKSLPQMAAGRLQRWSLYLSGFDYTFKHVKGTENFSADCMSRLPLRYEECKDNSIKKYDYINFVENQHVINLHLVRSETRKDCILSSLFNMIRYGFPVRLENNFLRPFWDKKSELYIDKGVIMWGYRVVIPKKLQSMLLKELHATHQGIVKMKSNSRSYFWWPYMDQDIEKYVKMCDVCMSARPEPQKSKIISWPKTHKPYERIHADFLGPINGKMVLLIVDSYTKWPEAFIMKSMDTKSTVDKFRECFSRFGLSEVVVTDNAMQFCSSEFSDFLTKNGIKHETSPPFHPATNGFAENAVRSFKSGMMKALRDKSNVQVSFETLMYRYLFHYRNSIHSVTGVSPSQLMFQRTLRTRFDLLSKGSDNNSNCNNNNNYRKEEMFKVGDYVYCRDYRNPNKKQFIKCVIDEVLGQRTYLCKLINEGLVWKRHVNQIIPSLPQAQGEENSECYNENNDVCLNKDFNSLPNDTIVFPVTSGTLPSVFITPNGNNFQDLDDSPLIPIIGSPRASNKVIPQVQNSPGVGNVSKDQVVNENNKAHINLRRSCRDIKAPVRLNL